MQPGRKCSVDLFPWPAELGLPGDACCYCGLVNWDKLREERLEEKIFVIHWK